MTVSQNCRRKMFKGVHFERDKGGDIQGPRDRANLGPQKDVTCSQQPINCSHPNNVFTIWKDAGYQGRATVNG